MPSSRLVIALCLLPSIAIAQPGAMPLDDGTQPPTAGMQPPPPQQPPPGSTHVTFISATAVPWDVTLGEQPACATPCTVWVIPLQFVTLHSREPQPVRLDLGYLPAGDLTVVAKPLASGQYAAGVTFTALTAMGLATGITLTAVGCSTNHSTMCTAGLITGLGSALGLYGSIMLLQQALPQARIGPARPYFSGSQVGLAGAF